jgi:hypothetical protein
MRWHIIDCSSWDVAPSRPTFLETTVLGGLRLSEGLGQLARVRTVAFNSSLECLCTGMYPAPQLFLDEQGKPSLCKLSQDALVGAKCR